jgi:tetratricopeptide (TPR) repeat protein
VGALCNLGSIYHALGELDRARYHHRHAMTLNRVIGSRQGEALAAKNLGLVMHDLGEFQAAQTLCQKALEIDRAIGDSEGEGYSLTYLALALEGLEEFEAAADAYYEALELRREIGQTSMAIDDLAGLARVKLKEGRIEQAKVYIDEILAWIEEHGPNGLEYPLRVYLSCFDVLEAVGQKELASTTLAAAQKILSEQAERISDPEARQTFLEQVPLHRQLSELAIEGSQG